MRLTATVIRQFESDQAIYGTAVALFNLLWLKAADDLQSIGVKKVTTVTHRKLPRARRRQAA